MKRIKKASKWIIPFALFLLVIVAVVFASKVLSIQKNSIVINDAAPLQDAIRSIPLDEGKVLVAESDTKELYVNTKNMNLFIKDKEKNVTWNAILESSKKSSELSLITVSFLGEDNSLTEWDSYNYCADKGSYSIDQLENGVRIQMNFNAGEATNLYEYMPSKISVERYETVILGGLEKLLNEGSLEEDLYKKYLKTLGLVYSKSKTEEAYTINYVGQPPESAAKQLIQITKLVGYTSDMLLEDADTYGFTVEFAEPAEFNLVLEAYLENDEFVVRIPCAEVTSLNDFYVVQNIKVLPNFSLVEAKEVEEGYLFVPDGAGALMAMNGYQAKVAEYSRDVYQSDFYKEYYYLSEFGEELMMPVFGMMLNSGSRKPFGFLGIIENGADTSYITAKLASADENDAGVVYNKIFASFDTVQYDHVKVFGEYSDRSTSYMVKTSFMDIDYTMRYILYPEAVGYYQMAKDYQAYLMGDEEVEEVYQKEASLYLNAIGAVTLTDRFLGIPYNYTASMTTYGQLQDILEDLEGRNAIVSYEGGYLGGIENQIMNNAKKEKVNGTDDEWKQLHTFLDEHNMQWFMGVNFMKVYNSGNGYISKIHALSDFSNNAAKIYGYSPLLATFMEGTSTYHLLKPTYLNSVVESFIEKDKDSTNLYLMDLGNQYYADYKNSNMVHAKEAQSVVNSVMDQLSTGRSLAVYNPRADKLKYTTIAVDISRESSNYGTFTISIPFRQLVMNGMCQYTTTNVNNNSKSANYYLLQAIETGAIPKYTITSESSDLFKNSHYTYYYDVQYDNMEEEIKALYDAYEEAMETIEVAQIVDHSIIQNNVFLTEYANGTRVITNYNGISVQVEDRTIDAYGYAIIRKGE